MATPYLPGYSDMIAVQDRNQQQGLNNLRAQQGILSINHAIRQQAMEEQTNPLRLKLLEAQVAAAANPRDWKPVKQFNAQTGREEMVLVNMKNPSEVLPLGGQQATRLDFHNTGGAVVGVDPYTGAPRASLPTSMTPAQADDAVWKRFTHTNPSATDRANIDLGSQRLGLSALETFYNTGMGPGAGPRAPGIHMPPASPMPPIMGQPQAPQPVLGPVPNLPQAAPSPAMMIPPAIQAQRDAEAARIRALEGQPGGGGAIPTSAVIPPIPPAPSTARPMLSPKQIAEIEAARLKNANEMKNKRDFNMTGIGEIISEAESILTGPNKPTSSLMGTTQDMTGAVVGLAVPGSREAEQLRAIGGALVARMPRMEGPQSDRDVLMYREMAGQIGDSTIPIARRVAALDSVKKLWAKYDKGTTQSPNRLRFDANGNQIR